MARSTIIKGGDGTVVVEIHVQPRASKPGLAGVHGDRLKVRLASPPVDNRANDEVVKLFAKLLGVPKRDVAIVHGHKGRDKAIAIEGVDETSVRQALGL